MSGAGDPGLFRREFEMGITRAEFLRLLPVAVRHEPFRVSGDDIVGERGPMPWRIRLEERPGRPFGAVTIPVLGVRLELQGASDAQAGAFVERFLLGFQRAGG